MLCVFDVKSSFSHPTPYTHDVNNHLIVVQKKGGKCEFF